MTRHAWGKSIRDWFSFEKNIALSIPKNLLQIKRHKIREVMIEVLMDFVNLYIEKKID